jgi:hypothetical protein
MFLGMYAKINNELKHLSNHQTTITLIQLEAHYFECMHAKERMN